MFYKKILETHRAYKKLKTYPHIQNDYWKAQLVEHEVSPQKVEYDQNKDKLFYKPLSIFLTPNKHDFILSKTSVSQSNALKNLLGCQFFIYGEDQLILKIKDTELIIGDQQELGIAYEVFLMAVYNFVYDKPVVVVDIGMNTGFASLYFASRDNTIATYSYEPFKATYEQAINNFSRNPSLQTKIKSFNYGVGGKEETLKVEYEYSVKGSIGIEGISSQYKDSVSQNIIQETLQIKPFNEVFQEILSEHPDTDIVAKIDCEGSEYEIIKSLAEHNQLNKIKIIMMEWHRHGPNPLIEELNKVGFISFSRLPYSKNVGNIYAIRC